MPSGGIPASFIVLFYLEDAGGAIHPGADRNGIP
jgi:hypothetical protein